MRGNVAVRSFALCLGVVLIACQTPALPVPAEPSETPVRGGVIVEPILQDITTLQPILTVRGTASQAIDLIYDTLFAPDPQTGEPRPHLGEWQLSADGRTYTWRIVSGASWSDGRPIVAADVATALKAYGKSKKTGDQHRFVEIEGFQEFAAGRAEEISGLVLDQQDPKRFLLRLTRSFCPMPLAPWTSPLPTHVFGKYLLPGSGDAIDRAPENDAPPVASGPFLFEEWRRGEHIRFARNATYWRGAPYLDGYVKKVLPAERWVEQLRSGALGFMPISVQFRSALPELERDPRLRVQRTLENAYSYIGWNTQSRTAPALRDRRVRQALAHAFDGDLALQQIVGVGARNYSHHVPVHWANPGGLYEYPYDPARAKRLIEEAGYSLGADGYYQKDGLPLAFSMETNRGNVQRELLLQLAVDQYRAIGVRVTPVLRTFPELVTRLNGSDEIEAFIVGWSLSPDGDPHDIWHSSRIPDPKTKRPDLANFSRLVVPGLDEAIEAARYGPDCSIAARKKHYATFNRILNEEQPYYFGFVNVNIRATTANLRGHQPGVFSEGDVHRWWLAPPK